MRWLHIQGGAAHGRRLKSMKTSEPIPALSDVSQYVICVPIYHLDMGYHPLLQGIKQNSTGALLAQHPQMSCRQPRLTINLPRTRFLLTKQHCRISLRGI